MSLLVVADAGPLIHLGETGRLALLVLFGEVIVPDEVWHESVREGRLQAEQLQALPNLSRRRVEPLEVLNFVAAHRLEHLHAGETECLCLCLKESIRLLLTDDLAVREVSARLGITPVGSLGVLVRAFRLGLLTLADAEKAITDLHERSSLFVTRALVDIALGQLRAAAR
jgi:predicted nucleic acid-binding protein